MTSVETRLRLNVFQCELKFCNFDHLLVEILETDSSRFESWQGQRFLSSPKGPNRLWDPTSLLFDVNRRISFSTIKRPGHKANHSPNLAKKGRVKLLSIKCVNQIFSGFPATFTVVWVTALSHCHAKVMSMLQIPWCFLNYRSTRNIWLTNGRKKHL